MLSEELERRHTLRTAVDRYETLRLRELSTHDLGDGDPHTPLSEDEALELLALSEVIARKAGYGRQPTVRAARAAGASWSRIGDALGTSKQSAWEAHNRWIDEQSAQHDRVDYEGLDAGEAAAARGTADPDGSG